MMHGQKHIKPYYVFKIPGLGSCGFLLYLFVMSYWGSNEISDITSHLL